MIARVVPVTVVLWVGLGAAPAHSQENAGAVIFRNQCSVCHATEPDKIKLGPSLAGVFGRSAASSPRFRYSAAMKTSGLVWNEATLKSFLAAPQEKVQGTMMTFAGIPNAAERDALAKYLMTLN